MQSANKRISVFAVAAIFTVSVAIAFNYFQSIDKSDNSLGFDNSSFIPEAQAAPQNPVADAGTDRLRSLTSSNTRLDGTKSVNKAGKRLVYNWSIVSGAGFFGCPTANSCSSSSGNLPSTNIIGLDLNPTVLELTVTEGNRTSPPDYVTVSGSNTRPIAHGGYDKRADVLDTVILDGSGSTDLNGDELTYNWSIVSSPVGSAVAIQDPNAPITSIMIDTAGDYLLELKVNDGTVDSEVDQILISTSNVPPVAISEPDIFVTSATGVGETVLFRRDLSFDVDGDEIDQDWTMVTRPDGSNAKPAKGNPAPPSITIDESGAYVVRLAVEDSTFLSENNIFLGGNTAPKADAGKDVPITVGQVVELEAGILIGPVSPTGISNVGGTSSSVRWDFLYKPAGSTAVLTDETTVRPSFQADVPGDYIVQLRYHSSSHRYEAVDTVVFSTNNIRPIANAGFDQTVSKGNIVQLDASASSDVDNDPLTYQWSLIQLAFHSNATLTNANTATPTFVADKDGPYVVQLIVSDGTTESIPDLVLIRTDNSRPVADAGLDKTVGIGSAISLEGSNSWDADSDTLSYYWARSYAKSVTIINNTSATASFTPSSPGSYIFQLVVTDGTYVSDPNFVVIDVTNTAPVANAGADQTVGIGNLASLDGSGSSDVENHPLTYLWSFVSIPAGSAAVINDSTLVQANFTADVLGDYVVELTVSDGYDSHSDQVTITSANNAPIANAGLDQNVVAPATVQLDGSASADPDGHALQYHFWQITSKPNGSLARLSDPALVNPTFVADMPGIFTVRLSVADSTGLTGFDDMTVIVSAPGSNLAPTLQPIGDQTVTLGERVRFYASATDPNGDAVSVSVSPMPLMANANYEPNTGLFYFDADADQAGIYQLTFTATDGNLSTSEIVTITVNDPTPGTLTSLTGRILDANDYAAAGLAGDYDDGPVPLYGLGVTPVTGVTVNILDGNVVVASAVTDADGFFTIPNITAEMPVIDIVNSPNHAGFREIYDLIADTDNVIERPFFMPQIDQSSLTTIDPNQTTVVMNATLGVSLSIPPNTAKDALGNDYTGQVSISEVPLGLAPVQMGELLMPSLLVTIQPVGVTYIAPVPITFPNNDNLTPGSEVDIWSVNTDTGEFFITGTGQVSPDGSQVVTISGGIVANDWHGFLPPWVCNLIGIIPPKLCASDSSDGKGEDDCDNGAGSAVRCDNGALSEVHNLPSYRSLSTNRTVTLYYDSSAADPRPVIDAPLVIGAVSALPDKVSAQLIVGGIKIDDPTYTDTAGLSESVNESLRQALMFDASNFETGSYPYALRLTNYFGNSAVGADVQDRVRVRNERNSPFGAGWSVAGLQRVHANPNDVTSLSISENRGDLVTFVSQVPGIPDSTGLGLGMAPRNPILGDFDADGKPDMAIPDLAANNIVILWGQGDGTFDEANPLVLAPTIRNNPTQVAAGDFNGDGIDDLVAGFAGGMTIRPSNGDRTFGAEYNGYSISQGRVATGLSVVDFDGDGNNDIMSSYTWGGSGFGHTQVSYGDGNGGVNSSWGSGVGAGTISSTTVADVDNDGDIDILRIIRPLSGSIFTRVLLNNAPTRTFSGSGQTLYQGGIWWSNNTLHVAQHMAVADFNQDGNGDIVFAGNTSDAIRIFPGNGDGTFGTEYLIQHTTRPTMLAVGDFNRDGKDDVVTTDEDTGVVSLHLGTGGYGLLPPLEFSGFISDPAGTDFHGLVAGDLNNDQWPDLVIANFDVGAMTIILGDLTGNLFYVAPDYDHTTLTINGDGTYQRLYKNGRAVDYDSDGYMVTDTDTNGNVSQFAYDAQDRLDSITDPLNKITTISYGTSQVTITDPANRATILDLDGNGDLVKITDADATERQFTYDARHRMTGQTNKRNQSTTYDYNFAGQMVMSHRPDGTTREATAMAASALIDPASGFGGLSNPAPNTRPEDAVASFKDGNGNSTTREMNSEGSPTSSTDALNRTVIREYDDDNNLTKVTDARGYVREMTYDDKGNTLSLKEAVGQPEERLTTYTYKTNLNRIATITIDAAGVTSLTTIFTYDGNGNLTELEDPENGASAKQILAYNVDGQVNSRTDRNGNQTTFGYDGDGNLETITDALLNVTKFVRDSAGRITDATQGFGTPEARTTHFVFDPLNRVTAITRGFGSSDASTTNYAYDNNGNIDTVTSATGQVTTYTYDNLDRVLTVNHPATGTAGYTYDNNGRPKTVTDNLGRVTEYFYDVANQLTQTRDAKLQDRFFTYDDNGNRLTVTDARNKTTTFTYDPLNRMKTRSNHLSETWSFTYDVRHNLLTTIDPKGQELARIYDNIDRLQSLELRPNQGAPADDTLSFTYDANGNLVAANDNDSDLVFTPDAVDRLQSANTDASGLQPVVGLTHSYNAVHDLTQTVDNAGAGGTTGYLYDFIGRLTQVTTPGAQVVALDHDDVGRITSIVNPNGIDAALGYDIAGRLQNLSHGPGGSELALKTYGYDTVGNINAITGLSRTRSFGYDELYRLTSAADTAGNESYTYDEEGNRTVSHKSVAHVTSDVNRLLEDDQYTYSYDLNGNLESKTNKVTTDVTTYGYDILNRLVLITFPDTTTASYAYDALSRRIEKNVDGTITRYVYDGDDIFLEYDGSNTLLARYSHGDRVDQPLVQERGGLSYFYHADHQGSVVALTDLAGITINSYSYDGYGGLLSSTEGLPNPYGFTGRERDSESA